MGAISGDERKTLEARCRDRLADLSLPEPFDLGELCRVVGAARGRPLRLAAEPLGVRGSGACGMLIGLADEDIIVVEQRTSALHQEHIALHEIGHLACGHEASAERMETSEALRLLPSLNPEMIRSVLGRTSYLDRQEQEAEMVATLLGERVYGRSRRIAQTPLGEEAGEGLRRLTRALGGL